MSVRALQEADIPVLAAWMSALPLWRRYGLTREKVEVQLKAALAADLLLVADAGEERACALAWCLRKGLFGRSPYLKLFGVRPELAGRGVGSRLLSGLEAALIGESDLFLLVSDFNSGAQRFYRRHGFAEVGSLKGYVRQDVTELLYRKRLGGSSPGGKRGSLDIGTTEREEP